MMLNKMNFKAIQLELWVLHTEIPPLRPGDAAAATGIPDFRPKMPLRRIDDLNSMQDLGNLHVDLEGLWGLGEPCQLCENECTGACQPDGVPIANAQDHHHHHATYPHADHPLGPRTLTPRP